ncbi:MAG: leucine-rich repeat domain-containing protein [Salinivirgaceae bacterium]|nr:leucine-rich repeat domain-containing protein [Salinivirgaceae bacterium]
MDKTGILQFINKSKLEKSEYIDLSNRDIDELPHEIGELIWVKKLNISYNNIVELPSSICNLVNLETLLITRNKVNKLPLGIGSLQKLKTFDLSYNPLVKISKEIALLSNLENFDASYCELRCLPVEITNLINIKKLNLEENPMEFPPQKVVKRGLYALMHFLSMEKRKKEASRVNMQVFNMPEKIQGAFRQYIRYFNEMISEANNKDVVFDLNFINQDFYQEMDLNAGVEGYLYDVMRYIHKKVESIRVTGELEEDISSAYFESRMSEVKERLHRFNNSLDDKIEEMRQMKREIRGLYESFDE